jgi:tetratricopeptide (TPR) repeat protein
MHKEAQAAFQELVDLDTSKGLTMSVALWNILWLVDTMCRQYIVDQAQPLLRQVLEDSPSQKVQRRASKLSHAIGVRLYAQWDFRAAHEFFKTAAAGRKEIYGPTHEATIESFLHLGKTLVHRGIYKGATDLLHDLEGTCKMVYGSDDSRTIICLTWLGVSFLKIGDYPIAHSHFAFAAPRLVDALGEEHEDTLECYHYLGLALHAERMSEKAEVLLQKTLATQRKVLGSDNLNTLATMSWLGYFLNDRKKYQDSEALLREAAEGLRQLIGNKNDVTLRTLTGLGRSIEAQKRWAEALEVYEEVYSVRRDKLGPTSEDALDTARDIRRCKTRLSKSTDSLPTDKRRTLFSLSRFRDKS